MALHDVLASKRDEVMERWKNAVRGTLAPEAMRPLELVDHLPKFLDEIVGALREQAGLSSSEPSPEQSSTAAVHGQQRLKLGFSVESVVREYGVLTDAIVATAREAGVEITMSELRLVFDCTVSGIADAVSEYARQRDAELMRQANEHFAFVAHELRNPLSTAALAVEHLKTSGDLPASRQATALERGLARASELIDQTLRNARIASGVDLRRQWTTLGQLIDDVELGNSPEATSRGVEIKVELASDDDVNVDVRLMRSAVGNLLRNAVKYTHSKSAVVVRGNIVSGRAVIEIEDCCGGLEPGKVEEAFAPFVRLDSKQSGFGLGLAIAKQAIDAHGGTIRVQNLPGKGCIFVLELPVDDASS